MPDVRDQVFAYIDEHLQESLDDLAAFCRIPSISSRSEGITEAAVFVANRLRDAGFRAEIMPTAGHPVVYGESDTGSGRTLLCYNHYDVQPPEPLDLWHSPPFEPAIRNGRMYARGVSDDKGQLISRIAALRAIRAVMGQLPARVKFLVEGEEEISSPNLEPFIAAQRDRLAADACVWEFGGIDHEGRPQVVLGLRGICYVEFHVRTLTRDAHSGGAHHLPNAAWRLVWALASIKGPDERIRIPGFYDGIVPPRAPEQRLLDEMPSDEDYIRSTYGVRNVVADRTGAAWKPAVYEPTANLAGFGSGWQGQGSKTVIPAEAMAKMDFRMVPGQDPADIVQKLRAYLDAQGFSDVEVRVLGLEKAGTTPPDEPFVQQAARTAEEVYGVAPVLIPLTGGTGPTHLFREYLQTPIVTLGPGDPDSRVHAPDESLSLAQFVKGTRHMASLLLAFAEG